MSNRWVDALNDAKDEINRLRKALDETSKQTSSLAHENERLKGALLSIRQVIEFSPIEERK